MPTTKMNGVQLIAAERTRQVADEGWTPYHDDLHTHTELAQAAICYVCHGQDRTTDPEHTSNAVRYTWPWEDVWWKPSDDPVRNLVKAGALIAAEIDRLQRLDSTKPT